MGNEEDTFRADGLLVTKRVEGDTATLILEGPVTETSVVALRIALGVLPDTVRNVTAEMRPTGAGVAAMVGSVAAASREAGLVVA